MSDEHRWTTIEKAWQVGPHDAADGEPATEDNIAILITSGLASNPADGAQIVRFYGDGFSSATDIALQPNGGVFLETVVPEPASLALLTVGGLLVLGRKRR